jgi:hypothetical protein
MGNGENEQFIEQKRRDIAQAKKIRESLEAKGELGEIWGGSRVDFSNIAQERAMSVAEFRKRQETFGDNILSETPSAPQEEHPQEEPDRAQPLENHEYFVPEEMPSSEEYSVESSADPSMTPDFFAGDEEERQHVALRQDDVPEPISEEPLYEARNDGKEEFGENSPKEESMSEPSGSDIPTPHVFLVMNMDEWNYAVETSRELGSFYAGGQLGSQCFASFGALCGGTKTTENGRMIVFCGNDAADERDGFLAQLIAEPEERSMFFEMFRPSGNRVFRVRIPRSSEELEMFAMDMTVVLGNGSVKIFFE